MAKKLYNFRVPVLDIKGEPAREGDKEVIIADHLQGLLLMGRQDDTAADKRRAFQLALSLNGTETDLTIDDKAFIKKLVESPIVTPLFCARVLEIIE